MVKQTIDFFQSVQSIAGWEFAQSKKQRIQSKSGKPVNSEFYITFRQSRSVFIYIFLSLAAEEAFGFNKVQQITQKLKGDSEESALKYQNCKKSLNLNWDGSTSLPNLQKQKREALEDQQQNLIEISQKIDEEEARQLLKSGLSQRKIQLDLHSNNGEEQETLIPELQNINDSVTIIFNPQKNVWLLAFFSHIQKKSEIIQNQPNQNTQVKVEQIPIPSQPSEIIAPVHPNPDERPLRPAVEQNNHSKKNIPNPDDRPLRPPADLVHRKEANKPVPTAPRHIKDPDEKILIPPSKDEIIVGKGYDLKQPKNEDTFKLVKNKSWSEWVLFLGTAALFTSALITRA